MEDFFPPVTSQPNSSANNDCNPMRQFCSLRSICLALLPFFFVFVACDSGGTNGGDVNNEFSLNVTPSNEAPSSLLTKAGPDTTINGFSFFYDGQTSDGEEVFGIYLSGTESFSAQKAQTGLFGFLARNSSRPSPGPYDVVATNQGVESGSFIGVLYEDFGMDGFQDAPFYLPQNGTVTLDQSSTDEVAGSVDLTAYEITLTTDGTVDSTLVDISGNFTAKDVEEFAPLQTPSN